MQYPYNTCDYLLHVFNLLKLVKTLAKTPPTHHWTGILNLGCENIEGLIPIYVYDQRSFQPLRIIP